MTSSLNLDSVLCRLRQSRLRGVLESLSLDAALIVSHDNIQWLTGFRPHRLMQASLVLETSGRCTLSAPNGVPEDIAADEVIAFPAQHCATLRQDQHQVSLTALAEVQQFGAIRNLGIEASVCGQHFRNITGCNPQAIVDLDSDLWRLRRRKDDDELKMIQRAIDCTTAMYRTAREIIEPGISELEVFNQLQAAAVEVAGEPLTATGNDYQCGTPGGPPRERNCESGELYILDLGPCYRGYYADNCRTFAVNNNPTDEQYSCWEQIVAVLKMVEETVRPGVSCRELYERAKAMLDESAQDAFFHHLGHGFGLFPHEAPHLNSNWDDVFEIGDCFTAEPGLYTESLRGGIRLEQDYRVTETGLERLTDFPLEL